MFNSTTTVTVRTESLPDVAQQPTSLRRDRSEQYHALVGRLRLTGRGAAAPRTVGVTSCASREGVSTVIANLALGAACTSGREVLLIDANPMRPSVHKTFRLRRRTPGLGDLLIGKAELPDVITRPSRLPNLSVIAAGRSLRSAPALYDAETMSALLEQLSEEFSLILVDLPPAVDSGPCLTLAGVLDGVLLVVESERTRSATARRATAHLAQAGGRVMGAVLNKRRRHLPRWLSRRL